MILPTFLNLRDDDLDAFGDDLEGHRQFADEFAVGLNLHVAVAAQARGRAERDAARALVSAAAHREREQAQVAETAVRVDDADLEGVRVEARAGRDREAAAVPPLRPSGRAGR